jgi:hypothetical protein
MSSHATVSIITAVLCVSFLNDARLQAQVPDSVAELVGLWKAKRRFGPDGRGQLIVQRTGNGYTADMMGFTIPVRLEDDELRFELPNREGAFRGKPQAGGIIRGFWFPVPIGSLGAATPVTVLPKGANRWSGQVVPLDEAAGVAVIARNALLVTAHERITDSHAKCLASPRISLAARRDTSSRLRPRASST